MAASTQQGPIGTPQHPAIPPLRTMRIVDADGIATPPFLNFLQQQFGLGSTISSAALAEAVASIPPGFFASAPNLGSFLLGGTATLVGGTVVVSQGNVSASSMIYLTGQNSSGTAGELSVSARTPGTSFTITSSSGSDTRLVAWLLIEPTVL